MAELDPATRARLADAADWLRRDEEDPAYIALGGDIETLLVALDAAVAARDAAVRDKALMLGSFEAVRAERDAALNGRDSWWRIAIRQRDYLDQHAAVVAAARDRAVALAEGIVQLGREGAVPVEMTWLEALARATLEAHHA